MGRTRRKGRPIKKGGGDREVKFTILVRQMTEVTKDDFVKWYNNQSKALMSFHKIKDLKYTYLSGSRISVSYKTSEPEDEDIHQSLADPDDDCNNPIEFCVSGIVI